MTKLSLFGPNKRHTPFELEQQVLLSGYVVFEHPRPDSRALMKETLTRLRKFNLNLDSGEGGYHHSFSFIYDKDRFEALHFQYLLSGLRS